jgi:hypothetical protein
LVKTGCSGIPGAVDRNLRAVTDDVLIRPNYHESSNYPYPGRRA